MNDHFTTFEYDLTKKDHAQMEVYATRHNLAQRLRDEDNSPSIMQRLNAFVTRITTRAKTKRQAQVNYSLNEVVVER